MYDHSENNAAHDTLLTSIHNTMGYGAKQLDHETGYMTSWGYHDLLLDQIYNLPYRAHFRDCITHITSTNYA